LGCILKLPKTNYHLNVENQVTDRFAGKIPLAKATSYLYYNKGGTGQIIVAEIKYRGNQSLGQWIGAYLAKELASTDFFRDIDYLIPVPLHPSKEKKRGFNQAERIAEGIARITKIPLETKNIYRNKANATQTKKSVYERWKNTFNLFEVNDIEMFRGKHLLLIDDVLTTGSTLEAVAQSVLPIENIKISILTLTIA
jgi:ComF family protein